MSVKSGDKVYEMSFKRGTPGHPTETYRWEHEGLWPTPNAAREEAKRKGWGLGEFMIVEREIR